MTKKFLGHPASLNATTLRGQALTCPLHGNQNTTTDDIFVTIYFGSTFYTKEQYRH